MRIGITERGDAGLDLSWVSKLPTVDGVILITKNINDNFIDAVMHTFYNFPMIIHCTCTGLGGTKIEPKVPSYTTQLKNLKRLLDLDFPRNHVVLRVDPIIPTDYGINRARLVLENFRNIFMNDIRVRVSVLDEYNHVKDRFKKSNIDCAYDEFQPSDEQLSMVAQMLNEFRFKYETCAESKLCSMLNNSEECGCISYKDIALMGLNTTDCMYENPQGRSGCHCLNCKTELLSNKHQCKHKCLYCYWR